MKIVSGEVTIPNELDSAVKNIYDTVFNGTIINSGSSEILAEELNICVGFETANIRLSRGKGARMC